MKGVAKSILVMGLSLAAIILAYLWFGHIGPSFSTAVMEEQQEDLIERFDLPPGESVPPELLEVPPSLRNVTQSQDTASQNETREE